MNEKEFIGIQIDNLETSSRPHNGNSISKVEISQNRKYLVTYSEDDNSIVGWKIEIEEKESGIIPLIDPKPKIKNVGRVYRMCISNNNILAYTYVNNDDDVKISK